MEGTFSCSYTVVVFFANVCYRAEHPELLSPRESSVLDSGCILTAMCSSLPVGS